MRPGRRADPDLLQCKNAPQTQIVFLNNRKTIVRKIERTVVVYIASPCGKNILMQQVRVQDVLVLTAGLSATP